MANRRPRGSYPLDSNSVIINLAEPHWLVAQSSPVEVIPLLVRPVFWEFNSEQRAYGWTEIMKRIHPDREHVERRGKIFGSELGGDDH